MQGRHKLKMEIKKYEKIARELQGRVLEGDCRVYHWDYTAHNALNIAINLVIGLEEAESEDIKENYSEKLKVLEHLQDPESGERYLSEGLPSLEYSRKVSTRRETLAYLKKTQSEVRGMFEKEIRREGIRMLERDMWKH
jgi:hypothetical protein